jgi:hypothetical protein
MANVFDESSFTAILMVGIALVISFISVLLYSRDARSSILRFVGHVVFRAAILVVIFSIGTLILTPIWTLFWAWVNHNLHSGGTR